MLRIPLNSLPAMIWETEVPLRFMAQMRIGAGLIIEHMLLQDYKLAAKIVNNSIFPFCR